MNIDKLKFALDLLNEIKSGMLLTGKVEALENIIQQDLDEKSAFSKLNTYPVCGSCGTEPIMSDSMTGNFRMYELKCPKCGMQSTTSNSMETVLSSWNISCATGIKWRISEMKNLQNKIDRFDAFFEPIRKLYEEEDTQDEY